MKKIPISVRVEPDLLNNLRRCSVATGKSVTDILEVAAAQWMVPVLADVERQRQARINFTGGTEE